MSFIENIDNNSSDSDIFVIKQIKPVSKITLQEALKIKHEVLSSSNTKISKKNGKGKTCNAGSSVTKLAKTKNRKKNLQTFSNNKECLSNWIRKSNVNSLENEIKSNKNEKNSDNLNVEFINRQEAEISVMSTFSGNSEKKSAESLELSPGISRRQKRFKIDITSPKAISPKKKVKKPLIRLFNMMDDDIVLPEKEPETGKTDFFKSEDSNKFSSDVTRNSDFLKETLNLKEYFGANESGLNLEELFCVDEFQSKLTDSINSFADVEKFSNNSELLCFLLKKIISDETQKQIDLKKQSLKYGKKIEKLLSDTECKILEKFFHLEKKVCNVFVRMLGRKKDWHRVSAIKYEDIGRNLKTEFEILRKEDFVDTNIEEESLETQMDLLSKPEILKLCKTFNVFLKSSNTCKKEMLINSLIEDSKKQKSVLDMFLKTKCTSRVDLIRTEVKNTLGFCVRIKNNIFKVFHKVLVLFSFAHYFDEEEKRFNNQLFLCYQVHKGMVKFPSYQLSPSVVFESKSDFEEYEKALLLQDSFEIATRNKNYNEFVSAFQKAKYEFVKLLKDQNYQNRYLSLKPFLRKFSAGTVYARILTNYCKKFKKMTDNLEIISTAQLLLDQNLFLIRKKGEWYEILSKALEIEKQNNAAAEVLIKSISDPHVNEVQKLTLQLRGQHILKKKTCGINDSVLRNMLDDVCISSIQEPASIEIKGKALGGNESGFKSIYIQDFQHGKMFTSVEERAITYYKSNGFSKGYHAEGFIVQTIYFILFFDIIYKSSLDGVFQTSFQEAPLDLYSSSFYHNRKEDIDLLLSEMLSWNNDQIETKIKDVYSRSYNINSVIKWNNDFNPELFCEIINCITMPVLLNIFQRFIKNLRVAQSGFPDLTLWNPENNKCKFVEVKSPNDKLSPAQRIWLDYLKSNGLDCEVCNVKNISSKNIE